MTVLEVSKRCGGTGGGGGGTGGTDSSWVNVPLTDAANYDTSCAYRYTINYLVDDMNRKWNDASSSVVYALSLSDKFLGAGLSNNTYYGIPSATKSKYGYRSATGVFTESTNVSISKVEKKC